MFPDPVLKEHEAVIKTSHAVPIGFTNEYQDTQIDTIIKGIHAQRGAKN